MTEVIFERLVNALRLRPRKLDELLVMATEAGSSWSREQLWLLFECMDGFLVEGGESPTIRLGEQSHQERLRDAIVDVVRSQAGRPMPAKEVLSLLPANIVTSAVQILATAKETPALEVFGPGLIRTKR